MFDSNNKSNFTPFQGKFMLEHHIKRVQSLFLSHTHADTHNHLQADRQGQGEKISLSTGIQGRSGQGVVEVDCG